MLALQLAVKRLNILLILIIAMLMLSIQIAYSQNNTAMENELKDILLEHPITIGAFSLTTQHGDSFDPSNFSRKWTFMFFGYTHCPDICPTTMTELVSMIKRIHPKPPLLVNTQVVFVSVDPRRDTEAHLKDYMAYFHEDFIGLTGSMTEINSLTKQLKIKHSIGEGTKDNYAVNPNNTVSPNYTVNHSSLVLLIDPNGRNVARFKPPHYGEVLYNQFDLIMKHTK